MVCRVDRTGVQGTGHRAAPPRQDGCGWVGAIVLVVLLFAPPLVGAQSADALIAAATAPLDSDLGEEAMVSVELANGHRRVLRWGTNPWISQVSESAGSRAHCYEGIAHQLFMAVVDQAGQPVLDLSAADVSVAQGGTGCTVVGLHPVPVPMKVVMLVDSSAAGRASLTSLRTALGEFLGTLSPSHEIGLVTVANQALLRVEFTTDRTKLQQGVDTLFTDSGTGTLFVDGLVETWNRRFIDSDEWPVFVVVLFDGPEASQTVQEEELDAFAQELFARAATVHVVLNSQVQGGRRRGSDFREGELQSGVASALTELTGGIYRALAAPVAMPEALTEIAATMNAQYEKAKDRYRVVYSCESGQGSAPINVGVSRPDLRLALFPSRLTMQ